LFCTYLLAIRIYASAKYISGDAKLRKEFYKSAASQLDLLKSIGVSEMEKEYENRIRIKEGFQPLEREMHGSKQRWTKQM
jgi:CRISPR/Cas system type I-B associated protein Csh2 (Cas7 group RAMP superfamily)